MFAVTVDDAACGGVPLVAAATEDSEGSRGHHRGNGIRWRPRCIGGNLG